MPHPLYDEPGKVASSDTMSADERTLIEQSSDDEGYHGTRASEASDGDHDILESEDERERLLTQKEGFSGLFNKKRVKIGKRQRSPRNAPTTKDREKGRNGEESTLMYEMEEGIGVSNPSLSRGSSESDEQRLLATATQRKASYVDYLTIRGANRNQRHVELAYGGASASTQASLVSSSFLCSPRIEHQRRLTAPPPQPWCPTAPRSLPLRLF